MSGTAVVIPLRGCHGGKSRLAPVLDPLQRSELVRSMARHVLAVVDVTIATGPVYIVTRDPDLDWLASDFGPRIAVQREPEFRSGLNAAIDLGREVARRHRVDRLLVLSADLPLLRPADLEQMLAARAPVVIGTDRFGEGTNALLLQSPAVLARFRFQFGPRSCQLHEGESVRLGVPCDVIATPGIGLDLDTPDDWAMLNVGAREMLLRSGNETETPASPMLLLETA